MKNILKHLLVCLLFIAPFSPATPQVKFFMIDATNSVAPDGRVKLASGSCSFTAASPFDVDLSPYTGTYKTITVRFINMAATNSTDGLHLQVSANGTAVDAGSTDYKTLYHLGDASGGSPAAFVNIIPSIFSNTAGETLVLM
jgi:hypothetical protein